VYGGIHFLGTSILNAPALLVGLPAYAMPLVAGLPPDHWLIDVS
jgi:hypothetical protein